MIVRTVEDLQRRVVARGMRRQPVARVRTRFEDGPPGQLRRRMRSIRGTRYYAVDRNLGGLDFSFKKLIPKPLRKIKPLKILGKIAKVAIPVAIGGGALFLAGKLGAKVVGGLLKRNAGAEVGPAVAPSPDVFLPPEQPTQQVYVQPQAYQPAVSPSQSGYAYPVNGPAISPVESVDARQVSPAGVSEMPGWVIPAGIGVALMLLRRR